MARRSTWRNSAATVALAIGLAGGTIGGFAGPAYADFAEGMAAYEAGDHALAMELWRPLAETGDAAAQYWVGRLFERGEGVPVSLARAAMWYRLAADQDAAEAQTALDGVLDTLRAREAGQSAPQVADAARPGAAPGVDTPDIEAPGYLPDRDPGLEPGATPQRDAAVGAPGELPAREGAPGVAGDGSAVADAVPPALPPRIGDAAADAVADAGADGADPDAVADAGYGPGEGPAGIGDGVADAEGAIGLDGAAEGPAEVDGAAAEGIADAVDGIDGVDGVAEDVQVEVPELAAVDDGVADGIDGVADGIDGIAEDIPADIPEVAAVDDGLADGLDPIDGDAYGLDGAEDGLGEDGLVADADAVAEAPVELAALDEDVVVDEPVDVAEIADPIMEDPAIDAAYGDETPGLDTLPPELAAAMADGALEAEEIEALLEDGVITPDMVDDLVDAGMLDADTLAQLADAGVLDAAALDALVDTGLMDEELVADARAALDGDATVTADGGTVLDDIVDGVTTFVRGDDAPDAVAPPRRLITERQ